MTLILFFGIGLSLFTLRNKINQVRVVDEVKSPDTKNEESVFKSMVAYDSQNDSVVIISKNIQPSSTITPIQTIPKSSYVLDQKLSPDNNYIYFTLATPLLYNSFDAKHNELGGVITINTLQNLF